MMSPDGRFSLVLNGEIYNYIELRDECRRAGAEFHTGTDTEVLLAAWALWGERCLTRLKGMFAFLIVDRAAGTATIARDYFGIKPLYFTVTPDVIAVASEVLTLVESGHAGIELHPDIAYEYLRFGAPRATDRTLLRDVQSLPAAHVAVFDFRSGVLSAARPYWSLRPTPRTIGFADAVVECRERFLENVRLHLRSDVPTGAALSGGIDSSAIVCAIRRLEPDLDLHTFSYIPSDRRISEEPWIDIVHQATGGIAHKIRPRPDALADQLELLVRRQGEPFASASIFGQFLVFERAREVGVPVVLDGQGADELLGGYLQFVGTRAAEDLLHGDVIGAARRFRDGADGVRGRLAIAGHLAQSLLPSGQLALARQIAGRSLCPPYIDQDWLRAQGVAWRRTAEAMIGRHRDLRAHLIDTIECGSLTNLLRYADRNAMAFSIENRVPFLTHDFADFLFSLPSEYLISRTGMRKHVFREAMKGILPEPIRQRRDKVGFEVDEAHWLRTSRDRFADVWQELSALPMIDERALARFLADFWAHLRSASPLVWRALVFALWYREAIRAQARSRASP